MPEHSFYVDIHTHHIPTKPCVAIMNVFPDESLSNNLLSTCFYSTGIHPWYLDTQQTYLKTISERMDLPQYIALGECGLDIFASASLEEQEKIFRLQIEISEAFKKPVIIHCVRAFNEIIRIKKDMKPIQPWILHGFNGNAVTIQQCLRHNMFFSFNAKSITLHNKTEYHHLPISSIFLETDNVDCPIDDIFTRFGLLMDYEPHMLKENLTKNFKDIFPFVPLIFT